MKKRYTRNEAIAKLESDCKRLDILGLCTKDNEIVRRYALEKERESRMKLLNNIRSLYGVHRATKTI